MTRLVVAATKGRIGAWTYYTSNWTLEEVAKRVRPIAEIHNASGLKDMIQRTLDDRAGAIADYLEQHDDRFFSSIVVGVYAGSPKWFEIVLDEDSFDLPLSPSERPQTTLGIMELGQGEILFALDGQHRVAGIKKAIEEGRIDPAEQVPIVLVPGSLDSRPVHDGLSGLQRTRRLFTHLNRYAKPVSVNDIVALDEDNVVAIVVRDFVDDNARWGRSLASSDDKALGPEHPAAVTSILAFYDFLSLVLQADLRDTWSEIQLARDQPATWKAFLQHRPSDDYITLFRQRARQIVDALAISFPQIQNALESTTPKRVVEEFRNRSGGHLLFRPIGWNIVGAGLQKYAKSNDVLDGIKALSHMPVELAEAPWCGLIFDSRKGTMHLKGQSVAKKLIMTMLGYEPPKSRKPELRGKTGFELLSAEYNQVTGMVLERTAVPKLI